MVLCIDCGRELERHGSGDRFRICVGMCHDCERKNDEYVKASGIRGGVLRCYERDDD